MRFRPKYFSEIWIAFAAWYVLLVLQLLRGNTPVDIVTQVCAALVLLGTLVVVVAYRFIYWELSPKGLLIQKLWKRRQIPWNEITRVGWLGVMSGTFSISIGRQIEDYDRLYFEPSDRAGLTDALRKFAPHATFEID
jgi:hypothetical protein